MTPKEKAQDLILKHLRVNHGFNVHIARQCALIAVDLLMEEAYRQHDYEGFKAYWKEVKHEIQKL